MYKSYGYRTRVYADITDDTNITNAKDRLAYYYGTKEDFQNII